MKSATVKSRSEKWALVTGASSGIGKDFCLELAERGWNVFLVARREDRLKELKVEIEKRFGVKADYLKADLSIWNDRESVIATFEKYPIRFFVNNAGSLSRGKFDERGLQESMSVIELNVTALVHLAREAVIRFKKSDSKCYLLNVGSLNSYISTGDSAIYSGTKAFVKSFSLALSEELKGTNVHCTCFCPGGTESEILSHTGVTLTSRGMKYMMKSSVVARIGIDATLREKHSSVPGFANKANVFLSKILPERWMTAMSSKILRLVMRPEIVYK